MSSDDPFSVLDEIDSKPPPKKGTPLWKQAARMMAGKASLDDPETSTDGPLMSVDPGQTQSVAPPAATAGQEQAAANAVATQVPTPGETTATPQPQMQQQATTQPSQTMLPAQQTVSTVAIPQKLLDNNEKILAARQGAIQAEFDSQKATNEQVAAVRRQQAVDTELYAQEQERIKAEREKAGQAKVADVTTAVQNFNNNSKINPNRYMENLGTGGRVMAAIAQAFGAFGSALTHSPNYAQEMIQRAIDADVKAQEHDVQTLGQKVQLAQNQYAMFRNQGLDEDSARAATRLLKSQQAQAQIDALLAGTKNEQMQATAQQLKLGLAASDNDRLMQLKAAHINAVKAAPSPPSAENQLKMRALEVEIPQADPKTGKELPPKTAYAKSPQAAEQIRQAQTVRANFNDGIEQLREFLKGTKVHSVGPNATQIDKMTKDLVTQYAVLRHLGAISKEDYSLASQLGDPSSMTQLDSTTFKLMDTMKQRLNDGFANELRSNGLFK